MITQRVQRGNSILIILLFNFFGWLNLGCSKNATDSSHVNTPPVASFQVIPENGFIQSYFIFDAFACKDLEDSTNSLLIRYDWENDGVWDTEYLTNQIMTHQYGTGGTYQINMQVKDSGELTDLSSRSITATSALRDTGTVTDIDGNVYKTIKIGDQWWMAENLKVTHYRNGDEIINVTDTISWIELSSGAFCDYDNNPVNSHVHGRLYNWYAASDSRNLAPAGWHIPSDEEWKVLESYHGMSQAETGKLGWRGAYEGGKMKQAGTLWDSPNIGAANLYGFSVIPGGYRYMHGYWYLGRLATFWSSTEGYDKLHGWCRYLLNSEITIWRSHVHKYNGYSIRCIKD